MEAGFIALLIIIAAVVGVIIGIYIERTRVRRRETHGVLNVDCSDPYCDPELFLGLTVPIADVVSQKHVVFSVNVLRRNSHE